ncbi:transglutaminase domain-containing protein [Tenacibaculum sp. M341]|uniref:transglutaminase domain-containing protein n=1 Tax=Tenacibaculum sp. M341 TaxID=2530339 RepID=UPI001050D9AC|nr:transglutaminase domain-containing protein [Tenacibaculum sp. M341]TCI93720.1 transglutaminase domain-containing protein [Tenacibaculum sp. M341]
MKKFLYAFLIVFLINCTNKTETYKGLPVLKTNKNAIDLKFNNMWFNGAWVIKKNNQQDSLKISCLSKQEPILFKSDVDSISFLIEEKKTYEFYAQYNDSIYGYIAITGETFPRETISFNKTNKNKSLFVKYTENNNVPYLKELEEKYPIKSVIANKSSDVDKILSVLNWTNNRWEHNGNVSPSKSDAITILNEASEGKNFPCFAYAIVLKSQLENAGFKARTIYLKTKDVEARKGSPGHVATEVYSTELKKWIFLDGQYNIMPMLDNTPLNAVELQNAITNDYDNLVMKSLEEVSKREYTEFVYDYLYYFDISLDQRHLNTTEKAHIIADKSGLMLVPEGSKNPTKIDFWKMTLDDFLYTNSLADFYADPVL